MNKLVFNIVALFSGVLFGAGMALSGMIDPAKVIGFLNVAGMATGEWDPSLAFVMGGALLVFLPAYFLLIKPKRKPIVGEAFSISTASSIDARLIGGASLFGLGWGVVGICPGPALASLALGSGAIWVFFIAMLVGSFGAKRVLR